MQNIDPHKFVYRSRLKESYSKCLTRLSTLALLVLSISLQSFNGHAAQVPSDNSRVVSLNVTVTNNKDGYVWGLDKDVFSIFVDKEQQEIVSIKTEDLPISVGILIDASGSMHESDPQGSAYNVIIGDAISRFVRASSPQNEYFLMSFNDQPKLLSDWTNDATALSQKIAPINPKGPTALYDACLQAIEKLNKTKNRKRVLVMISDGGDNSSHHKLNDLKLELQKSPDILLYAIGFGASAEGYFGINKGDLYAATLLIKWAAETGGKAVFPDSTPKLKTIMDGLAVELQHQYLISFVPTNHLNNGRWHAIKVKVTPKPDAPRELQHLSSRAPEGFYATKQ